MFVGRSRLLATLHDLVPVTDHVTKPVVVIEGCGGSGRTKLLEKLAEQWQHKTPTVLVRPRELDDDDKSAVRPVLASIMLGLSLGHQDYKLTFPRVVLAHIAMSEDDSDIDSAVTVDRLVQRINRYAEQSVLTGFLKDLVLAAGGLAANIDIPAVATVAEPTAKQIAEGMVDRLRRSPWLAKHTWSDEVWSWFSHQGQGFSHQSVQALLRLSRQYRSEDKDIRQDVDDLLVAALLADLRHNLATVTNRPANVLVLVDDGDTPAAKSFIRVRKAIADTANNPESRKPDPLTIVATSSGPLAAELTRERPPAAYLAEDRLAESTTVSGAWVRLSTTNLDRDHVLQLAKDRTWPDDLKFGIGAIARPVYTLTKGHPKATTLVLECLEKHPALVKAMDLDRLLGGIDGSPGLQDELLLPFVRAIEIDGVEDPDVLASLITLSAARNRQEADSLQRLLPSRVNARSPLFTSPTLWVDGHRRLHPLVRYLGIRALAARTGEDDTGWNRVFEVLRADADLPGRLHHDRMLGRRDDVASELAGLLSEMPSEEVTDWWRLSLLALVVLLIGATVAVFDQVSPWRGCKVGGWQDSDIWQDSSGDCVGLSDGSYAFDIAAVAPVMSVIAEQNQSAAKDCGQNGKEVTVAVLLTLTDRFAGSRALHELEGMAAAQRRANGTGCVHAMRLIVGHVGQYGAENTPAKVATRLIEEHPEVVAVAGIGLSHQYSADVVLRGAENAEE